MSSFFGHSKARTNSSTKNPGHIVTRPQYERQPSNVSPNSYSAAQQAKIDSSAQSPTDSASTSMTGISELRKQQMSQDSNYNTSPPQSSSSSIKHSYSQGRLNHPRFDGGFSFDNPPSDSFNDRSYGPLTPMDQGNSYPRNYTATSPTAASTSGFSNNPEIGYFDEHEEDRRPSVASITTNASSTNSKTSISRRLTGKMHNIFGESNSENSSSQQGHHHMPHIPHIHHSGSIAIPNNQSQSDAELQPKHKLSMGLGANTTSSNGITRPRTPMSSSYNDAAPFLTEEPQELEQLKKTPTSIPSSERHLSPHSEYPKSSTHSLPFNRRRTTRPNTSSGADENKTPTEDPRSRGLKRDMFGASSTNLPRSVSPSPSMNSMSSNNRALRQDTVPADKAKSSFWPFKRSKGRKEDETDAAKARVEQGPKRGSSAGHANQEFHINPSLYDFAPASQSKKNMAGSAPLGKLKATRRGETYDRKDSSMKRNVDESNIFLLDTDLKNMEGIVQPMTPPETQEQQYMPLQPEGTTKGSVDGSKADLMAAWAAPESWAVKPTLDTEEAQPEEEEVVEAPGRKASLAQQFCVRVFRADGSFTTLSSSLNSNVTELLQQLGKKSFLQDDLSNYVIILRKQDQAKIMGSNEKPLYIQKKLLEQAGYTEKDHLEEIGREDHSYLCRFTFLPSRVGGHSIDSDQGLQKLNKYNFVDLQGRNLLTIPIALYHRANEINTLNLSRNLSLDVPLDFIQACTNLKQITFRNNEAWRLPASFAHVQKLTYLDASNNRLEDVSSARLERHLDLVGLKLSNNRMTTLPDTYRVFRYLKGLNLASNNLTTVPPVVCDLLTLEELDLSYNQIEEIPESFSNLRSLERLVLSNNRIKALSAGIAGCKALKELDIRYNALHIIDEVTELPVLETLYAGHNTITSFDCKFEKLKALHLNNNKMTNFTVSQALPTLSYLNLSEGKLASFSDIICNNLLNLEKLILDRNTIGLFPPQIGKLKRMVHISCHNNSLGTLPAEMGALTELRYLDLHGNNIGTLPPAIWTMVGLQTLNLSSNILQNFPKPPLTVNLASNQAQNSSALENTVQSPEVIDELSPLDTTMRRPSQQSNGLLSVTSSPNGTGRKGSIASLYQNPSTIAARKNSVVSKASSDNTANANGTRKDSGASSRVANTFAQTLRYLYLADNRFPDEVFDEISLLGELRVLNLSYNEIYDIPIRALSRLPFLSELYLSGNEMTSLPTDDLGNISALKMLYINGNKFQTLPAELGKIKKLHILDVGSNSLKYNISNWPYDWNWNWNLELRYLNLSGNRRLEIKANMSSNGPRDQSFTDFNALKQLRILGLMDVTTTNPSFPDETDDCRVRTSGSIVKNMQYGMADCLGRSEHLSIIDIVVPRFQKNEDEVLLGFFDGQALSWGGSKMAKFLQEHVQFFLQDELRKLRKEETVQDALRRAFLAMNREIGTTGLSLDADKGTSARDRHRGAIVGNTVLSKEDTATGATSTLIYIKGNDMYCANVGDAMAIMVQSNGESKVLSQKHDPLQPQELERVRETGGFVSRNMKVNDVLDVSRAFGYLPLMPSIMASPSVHEWKITDSDEFVIIASKELWEYISYRTAVDIARTEKKDLMRAAQKLRDFAMSYGAQGKIIVMIIGVGDLVRVRRRGPYHGDDDMLAPQQRRKPKTDVAFDSKLQRLDPEIAPPEGDVCLAFTDIKGSTYLWETQPIAMRSAIKEHNEIMRRQLRIWSGYEVKTEGDAFMCSFQTVTSAMLWCFSVQLALLESDGWPNEILRTEQCQELRADDEEKTLLYRGISVRMGIHYGRPVCERDPITRRMDYFGPMVNRAARIQGVADGGQITVSTDFLNELKRIQEVYGDGDEHKEGVQDEFYGDEILDRQVRREVKYMKSKNGYGLKEFGERKLKGLENPEFIYLVFPQQLAGRETMNLSKLQPQTQVGLSPDQILPLFDTCLKLEHICSMLNSKNLKSEFIEDNAYSKEMVQKKIAEGTADVRIMEFVETVVTRVENSINTLYLRTLLKGIPTVLPDEPNGSVGGALSFTSPLEGILASLKTLLATDPRLQTMVSNSPSSAEYTDGTFVEGGSRYAEPNEMSE